jgi:hypothetical protein
MLTTAVAALTASVVLSTCSKSPTGPTGTTPTNPNIPGPTVPGTTVPVPTPGAVTFSGAGDIAICASGAQKAGNQEATAKLLEGLGGTCSRSATTAPERLACRLQQLLCEVVGPSLRP